MTDMRRAGRPATDGSTSRAPMPRAAAPQSFGSILMEAGDDRPPLSADAAPECFHDLNLDKIVDAVVAPWQAYDLAPFFHAPLHELGTIEARQAVFRDLEDKPLLRDVDAFAERMRTMRACLVNADKRYDEHERQFWFLHAALVYCDALQAFRRRLRDAEVASPGMRSFRAWLDGYVDSPAYRSLADEATAVEAALSAIRYAIEMADDTVTVQRYDGEIDYTAAVEETFAKFRQGGEDHRPLELPKPSGMNHIEAQIVDRVALLYPEPFAALAAFRIDHARFVDRVVERFDREIQFYAAWLAHIDVLKGAGLRFCYPVVAADSKAVASRGGFDMALAARLVDEKTAVICNDFELAGAERIFVVSGPNNGGKTTFARMFGQLHYLARLGCPVAGTQARLFLCDRIFTHFEREEDVATLRGKLEDELVRIHAIVEAATASSIVVMNEIFASTTLQDAAWLGTRVIERLLERDLIAVCVTFLDELASLGAGTVSMVSTVDPRDPAIRTYKVERRPADGLAYAFAIAAKHGVTRGRLLERIAP